jgi:branched-chain amino acid transport system substrate-binding protein
MRRVVPLLVVSFLAWAASPGWAQTQPPILIVTLAELSGAGAIAGTNFKNGVELAFKEINAAGGILGQKIQVIALDTETKPDVARLLAQRVAALKPYAVMGPVFSGITLAAMEQTRVAEIPTFTGGEATTITRQGNPFIFRTSLAQDAAMPKLVRYLKETARPKTLSMVWVNNDFGKGGRDAMTKALEGQDITVVADIPTNQGQVGFADAVAQVKKANAEALFVYLNEEESGHFLRELDKQGYEKLTIGETTLLGQKVIELAGEAANGIIGHVGLTPDALIPSVRDFSNRYLREYRGKSDHNGMKGYIAAHVLKAVTDKIGKFDSKEFAAAMNGVSLTVKDHPGILLDVKYDDKGDLDRVSFIVRVSGGRHEFIATVPAAAATGATGPAMR